MQAIDRLKQLAAIENRKIIGEAIVTLLVGIGTLVLVYGVLFWLCWFAFTMFGRSLRLGSAATSALIVTALFALVSIWSAWRRHDPMSDIQAMDPNLQDIQLGLGYALGVPIVNRQSIAGFAALFIGGFANIMDAWSLWRSRLRLTSASVDEAGRLLQGSTKGVAIQMVKDPTALALLYRLGLVKAVKTGESVSVSATMKGLDLLSAKAPPHR